ncbi:hypothetical protein HPB48_009620 [Haemaphysalis longicornis]|uniref:Uncharacterized protein n=1 Tax=Haemaphysalis longicornis TaxID=44386 RepID=A0A9J6FSC2_HAELO|nr:hypothetical protein HPB48_009620 [Haemaphysalis longicornis]
MSDAQRYRYRVQGFGVHVDYRVIEFLDDVEDVCVCSYCGVVSQRSYVFTCLHVACFLCKSKFPDDMCHIDKKRHSLVVQKKYFGTVNAKKVRCLNTDSGCNFTGPLGELNDHLISCDFYLTTCQKCEAAVVFKDMTEHYPQCKGRGVDTVVLAASDARSLLEDFGNAHNELQRALDSNTADGERELKAAVASLGEQFARLQGQLAVPGAGTAASGLSRPGK